MNEQRHACMYCSHFEPDTWACTKLPTFKVFDTVRRKPVEIRVNTQPLYSCDSFERYTGPVPA